MGAAVGQLPAGAAAFGGGLTALRRIGAAAVWAVILSLLAAVLVPPFLDHVYYDGPVSGHYDGERFFNPDANPVPGLSGPRGGVLTRFIPGQPPTPPWPERVAVDPVDPAALPPLNAGEMRAIWIGHATVLIQTPTLNILTDPIWSDVTGPFNLVGPTRVMAPGIAFDRLPRIDIVVVSHNHYDHLDLATLERLWARDRPAIVTSLGNDTILADRNIASKAIDWGEAARIEGATVHVTRNHHWGSRWLTDRNRALWSSFVIETPEGSIFFAGDTGPGDMRWPDEARRFGPVRLAILPIGAFRFVPGQMVAGAHIGPRESVEVMESLDAAMAIPIHWGTFRLSLEAWGTPVALLRQYLACAGLPLSRFPPVMPGKPMMVPARAPGPVAKAPATTCRDDATEIARFP